MSTISKTFLFENEDDTIGNLLQSELLKDNEVIFAGYIRPHLLENYIKLDITVSANNDPNKKLLQAIQKIKNKINKLQINK